MHVLSYVESLVLGALIVIFKKLHLQFLNYDVLNSKINKLTRTEG